MNSQITFPKVKLATLILTFFFQKWWKCILPSPAIQVIEEGIIPTQIFCLCAVARIELGAVGQETVMLALHQPRVPFVEQLDVMLIKVKKESILGLEDPAGRGR